MIPRGIGLAFTLFIVAFSVLAVGCSSVDRSANEPAVASARGYAQTVPAVLAGGDLAILAPYATPDQVDRVRRYRLLLEGERGQLLATQLLSWRPLEIEPAGDAVTVSAAETWSSQSIDATTGQPEGEMERRRVVTDYRVVNVDGQWLVDNLTERSSERR